MSSNKYIGNNKLVLLICAPDLTASGSVEASQARTLRFGMSLFLVISYSIFKRAFSLYLEYPLHVFMLDFLGLHQLSFSALISLLGNMWVVYHFHRQIRVKPFGSRFIKQLR